MSIGDFSKKGIVAGAAFLAAIPALNLDKVQNVLESFTLLVKTLSGKEEPAPAHPQHATHAVPAQPQPIPVATPPAPAQAVAPGAQTASEPVPALQPAVLPQPAPPEPAPATVAAPAASVPAPAPQAQTAAAAMPAASPATGPDASIYRITTAEGLQNIARDLNGYFELAADIDASLTSQWNDGKGFLPVGTEEKPFTGTLAGNGHTVAGLTINRRELNNVGLFGATKRATISGIHLERVNIAGADAVGGLLGLSSDTAVKQVSADGTVKGAESVGGLIGWQVGGSVDLAYSSGSVTGTTSAAGGLIGYTETGAAVDNTYSTADVNGEDSVGGLIGWNSESTVSHSYAAGRVRGSEDASGLIGYDEAGTVVASFWDKDATGQAEGIVSGDDEENEDLELSGLKTRQLQDAGGFPKLSNWNFDTTWRFSGAGGYPRLVLPAPATPVATSGGRDESLPLQ